jgi:hypothetical protein
VKSKISHLTFAIWRTKMEVYREGLQGFERLR